MFGLQKVRNFLYDATHARQTAENEVVCASRNVGRVMGSISSINEFYNAGAISHHELASQQTIPSAWRLFLKESKKSDEQMDGL